MKKVTLIAGLLLLTCIISAQQVSVSKALMDSVYEAVSTPYKYGLVMVPDSNHLKFDCPSVFRKGRSWYMTYIVFDGRGYETWIAKSKDLLQWKTLGRILSFSDTTDWDNNQKAGYATLQDPRWGGSYALEKYQRRYWMSYIGGSDRGYESGKLAIGMAYTKKNPVRPHAWELVKKPVLTPSDPDVRWWENNKLYKSTVVRDPEKRMGYPFVMYYNANGDTSGNKPQWRWFERIGMAVSDDMVNWKRYLEEPVVHHRTGITGDAVLQRMGDLWVMFYFGAFWEGRKDAFNRFACSYDLVNWTDWHGDDLIKPSEPYDERYAHKSFVVRHKGVVYHYYCAVDKKDNRGIAVATSKDKGLSGISFVNPKH
jgi:predicted GH43/DUF377 family glycosyl hydrolase